MIVTQHCSECGRPVEITIVFPEERRVEYIIPRCFCGYQAADLRDLGDDQALLLQRELSKIIDYIGRK